MASDFELPNALKVIMAFVDRVGFPILAFVLMFYFAFFSLQKATDALVENTKVLSTTSSISQEMLRVVQTNQGVLMADMKCLLTKK
jgi:hypothetical protein